MGCRDELVPSGSPETDFKAPPYPLVEGSFEISELLLPKMLPENQEPEWADFLGLLVPQCGSGIAAITTKDRE